MENLTVFMVFGAGLLSVLSPCVLPVVPIVVTGSNNDHKFRPLLIVAGLSLAFVAMGLLSALFGSIIGQYVQKIEKVAALFLIVSGVLLIADTSFFKKLSFFSGIASSSRGRLNGFFLGFLLGLVWIPCIGPVLSGVLALVVADGSVVKGVVYLFVYSAGFSVPMLFAGFASQAFRARMGFIMKRNRIVSIVSGVVLVIIGILILRLGMLGLGTMGF